jgi:mannose-6-phosphate isomerase class I
MNGTKNLHSPMVEAPYFVVDLFSLKEPQQFSTKDESGKGSVQILVTVEGCGVLEAHGMEPVTLAKGDAVVVPAAFPAFSVRPQWSAEILKAYVPGRPFPEPDSRL